ncbi:MAG: DUF6503 family protein [Cyclobacteriaceae bacterium]
MKYPILLLAFTFTMCQSPAEEDQTTGDTAACRSPAEELLDKTISYHDPENRWAEYTADITQNSRMMREGDDTTLIRTRRISMDNGRAYFSMEQEADGYTVRRTVAADSMCMSEWDKPELTAEDSTTMALNCDRAEMMRNYFRYLIGLPMVLKDEGTQLSDQVASEQLFGQSYRTLTVNYEGDEPEWTFFIDTTDYRLAAARFVKADSTGEYIVFNDEAEDKGIRHVGSFYWYYLDKMPLAVEEYTFK